jgi:hypothetical protein
MTYAIANHQLANLDQEETIWDFPEGRIAKICGWSIPKRVLVQLQLKNSHDAYLSNNGYWSADMKTALERILLAPAAEIEIKGNCLSMFVPPEWAEDNGNPNSKEIYRVWRNQSSWDAELIEPPKLRIAQNYPDYI